MSTQEVDVDGLLLSREEFDEAVRIIYSGDFRPLIPAVRRRTHDIRRVHEAELRASGVAVADLPPPDQHLRRASPRVKVKEVAPGVLMAGPVRIPPKFYEPRRDTNQPVPECCRHHENHDFSAWYSMAADEAIGVPDVYIFHCNCGRVHRRFMVGQSPDTPQKLADWAKEGRELEKRIKWDIR